MSIVFWHIFVLFKNIAIMTGVDLVIVIMLILSKLY